MDLGFRGEVADLYHRYRRGYPPDVLDALVRAFALTPDDLVVDLGCGTGQLALPMAPRVRAALGVDPEPDMLLRARAAAGELAVVNASWLVGSDAEIPALAALLGERSVGAITIGQALHWMQPDALFPVLAALARPGGGVAVVTNGAPLWLQDAAWSRALRTCLGQWLGSDPSNPCGTDPASQQRYRAGLTAAGLDVSEIAVDYTVELDLDRIVGGVYSAMSVERLPSPDERPRFAETIRAALEPHAPFTERVHVAMLVGRVR